MRSQTFLIIAFAALLAACGGSEGPNINMANNSTVNTNGSSPANSGKLEPTPAPVAQTANDAPTLAPVVHAYYGALKKKDGGAVRQVMSQGFIQSAEGDMKESGQKDLITYLTEFDKLPADKMEVRNEQISGNRGTAEVKGGSYSTWAKLVFVNEGGSWKITNEVPR